MNFERGTRGKGSRVHPVERTLTGGPFKFSCYPITVCHAAPEKAHDLDRNSLAIFLVGDTVFAAEIIEGFCQHR